MARVVLSPEAEKDLLDLLAYLAERSDRAADWFIERADLVFADLAEYPLMGRARYELVPGMHSLFADGYVFFYFPPADNSDIVLIARVVRAERDLDALFGGEG